MRKSPLMIVGALAFFTLSTVSAVVLQGPIYSPTGSDFQIVALQGITTGNPLGQTGGNPQVNTDFEFTPSIGVSYDTGNSHLKDFGLGLYQDSSHTTFSTGLQVNYSAPVDAASVTITVEDFDIKATDTGFNLAGKVAPTISLLGNNHQVLATFTQDQIFPALVANTSTSSNHNSDIWDINFGKLLQIAHLNSSQITGFVLSADMANGEKSNSDPYLLLAIGNGIPVIPEVSNYVAGLVALAFAGVSLLRGKRAARSA